MDYIRKTLPNEIQLEIKQRYLERSGSMIVTEPSDNTIEIRRDSEEASSVNVDQVMAESKNQEVSNVLSSKSYQFYLSEPPKTSTDLHDGYTSVKTSGNMLRCGYYALAIGILGVPETKRDAVLDVIGVNGRIKSKFKSQYSETELFHLQKQIGDQIARYAATNERNILQQIPGDIPIEVLEEDVYGQQFISGNFLQLIAMSLELTVVLFNHNQVNQENAIYIRRVNGNHYEGQLPVEMVIKEDDWVLQQSIVDAKNVMPSAPWIRNAERLKLFDENNDHGFFIGLQRSMGISKACEHVLINTQLNGECLSIPGVLKLINVWIVLFKELIHHSTCEM